MEKIIILLLIAIITLSGCASEATDEDNGPRDVAPNETSENMPDAKLDVKPVTNDLPEHEEIWGIVEFVGNDYFEISVTISKDLEMNEAEVGVLHSDERAMIVVDANTSFEMVASDGFHELDRWEGSFADLSVGDSVAIVGQALGDEFLASELVIWVWQ